ncbi:uncharacterized protein LOC118803580, partial [Tachysurus ichikawai]
MFLSVGHTSGLPDFGEIVKMIIVNNKVSFILKLFKAWYIEHLQSYELTSNCTSDLQVVEPQELNGYHPVYPYVHPPFPIGPLNRQSSGFKSDVMSPYSNHNHPSNATGGGQVALSFSLILSVTLCQSR